MGENIFGHVEINDDEGWLYEASLEKIFKEVFDLVPRSHSFFYMLNNMGDESFTSEISFSPKGLPIDLSLTVREIINNDPWNENYGYSWLTYQELKRVSTEFILSCSFIPLFEFMKKQAQAHGNSNVRFVFWFD